jgi:hypothetical protein
MIALAAAVVTAAGAVGTGSFALVPACAWWSRARRWLLRLVLGLGLAPLLLMAVHEVAGVRVGAPLAVVLAVGGLGLAGWQERRWRFEPEAPVDIPILLVLAIGLLFTALQGLIGQPGFDGLDPWQHTFAAAYVADTGVLRQPDPTFPLVHYVDAYPPLFDLLLAFPIALLGNVPAACKGVAALLVAVAPLALWLLARSLWPEAPQRAAAATVLYAVMPNAVTRHLWGHSLAIVLALAGLVAAVELRHSRWWAVPLAVAFGGAVLAAPTQGLKAGLLVVAALAVAVVVDRRWALALLVAGAVALAVAAVWFVPAASRSGWHPERLVRAMQPAELRRVDDPLAALEAEQEAPLPWAAKPHDRVRVADVLLLRPYGWLLRLTGTKQFMSNVPAGFGVPILVLLAAAVITGWRRPPPVERVLLVVWVLVAALLVLGAPLGVRLFPWRSWLLLAPMAALVAADGMSRIERSRSWWPLVAVTLAGLHAAVALGFDMSGGLLLAQLAQPEWLVVLAACGWWLWRLGGSSSRSRLAVAVVLAHLLVAGPVRAASLVEPLPPRVFYDRQEHRGYVALAATLPANARVWPLSGGMRYDILTGLGLRPTPYRAEELEMMRRCTSGETPPVDELVEFLHRANYGWLVLDPSYGELQRARGTPDEVARVRQQLERCGDLEEVRADGDFTVWRVADSR